MKKILVLTSLILLPLHPMASVEKFEAMASDYKSSYPEMLETQYRLRIETYYAQRAFDLKTYAEHLINEAAALNRTSVSNEKNWTNLLAKQQGSGDVERTALEALTYKTVQKRTLRRINENKAQLDELFEYYPEACSEDHGNKVTDIWAPSKIYPVYHIVMGADLMPSLEIPFSIAANYNYSGGTHSGGASLGASEDPGQSIESSFIGTGVGILISNPEPLFTKIAAVALIVIGFGLFVVNSLKAVKKWKEMRDKIIGIYNDLNQFFVKTHQDLDTKSAVIVKDSCKEALFLNDEDRVVPAQESVLYSYILSAKNKVAEIQTLVAKGHKKIEHEYEKKLQEKYKKLLESEVKYFNLLDKFGEKAITKSFANLYQDEANLNRVATLSFANFFKRVKEISSDQTKERDREAMFNDLNRVWNDHIKTDSQMNLGKGRESRVWNIRSPFLIELISQEVL